ncbi:hypothetical protein AURDEDRAFT_173134 [Auricularia subglabra TFB-10046 SS5]|nr:hypothetical protein AURDEDRAFT_173134 [Auricularia subglabra TFB-10046 SS5]
MARQLDPVLIKRPAVKTKSPTAAGYSSDDSQAGAAYITEQHVQISAARCQP